MAGFARINIEAQAWGDLRFAKLARYLNLADHEHALIKCARLWSWQTENYSPDRPTYVVDADTVDAALGIRDSAPAMVKADLAEEVPDGFRICGSAGRIEWLWGNRTARNRRPPHRRVSPDRSGDLSTDLSTAPSSSLFSLSTEEEDHVRGAVAPPDAETSRIEKTAKAAAARQRAEQVRAEKIARMPARAWKAADYMRDLVLAEHPGAVIGSRDWTDRTFRFRWADSIRVMVERDGRTYEQIAEALDWLFRRQPAGPHRYIVQSPDALREKWDRIEANRRNKETAAPQGSGPIRKVRDL